MRRVLLITGMLLVAALLSTAALADHTHCGGTTPTWASENCYDDCTNLGDCLKCVRDAYEQHCGDSCVGSFHPSRWDTCPDICREGMIRNVGKCIDEFSLPTTTSSGFEIGTRCWLQTENYADCTLCIDEQVDEARGVCENASSYSVDCEILDDLEGSGLVIAYEQYCDFSLNGGPTPTYMVLP